MLRGVDEWIKSRSFTFLFHTILLDKTEYRFLNIPHSVDGWQQHGSSMVEEIAAYFMDGSSCLLVFNIVMTINLRTSVYSNNIIKKVRIGRSSILRKKEIPTLNKNLVKPKSIL